MGPLFRFDFFLNLCKGTARSKEFFVIFLLAYALFIPMCRDEIHRILAEDTIRLPSQSDSEQSERSFVVQRFSAVYHPISNTVIV